MDVVDFCDFCNSLPNVDESLPFGDSTLVYKVGGRMFAAIGLDHPDHFVVKCDPERAIELRDRYEQVQPAWHFNKRHWNDIYFERLPRKIVEREIRHSYLTVIRENVTPKALREELLAIARKSNIEDAEPIE